MAHPDRTDLVQTLQYRLGTGPGAIPVAWDDEGPPKRDTERLWRVARRAWLAYDPGADWHLLLQDDAIPIPGLLEETARALPHVPLHAILSLYLGNTRPIPRVWEELGGRADEAGASWVVGPRSMWGVALALPVPVIEEMVEFCDRQTGIPDDMRVGRWARRKHREAWFPWPSFVDHPPGDSLLGHNAARSAIRFRGDSPWRPDGPVVRHDRR